MGMLQIQSSSSQQLQRTRVDQMLPNMRSAGDNCGKVTSVALDAVQL